MESASLSIQHLGSMIQPEARCGCRVLDQTSNPGSHGSMLLFNEFLLSQSMSFYSLVMFWERHIEFVLVKVPPRPEVGHHSTSPNDWALRMMTVAPL